MSTGFFSATRECHKNVMDDLYEYLASDEEVYGLNSQKTFAPISVYMFEPTCITHFMQMLEFYHTNSLHEKNAEEYFQKQLKKEGISNPKSYFQINTEDIVLWMDESDMYYKTHELQKLCVTSNIQIQSLTQKTFNYENHRASLNETEQSLTDYLNEILQPKDQTPDMPGVAITKIHKLDAFIVFTKESVANEHDLEFTNNVINSFDRSNSSQQSHDDFLEYILKKNAKPFFYMVTRICFIKNTKFVDPYNLLTRNEPTIKMGLDILKRHQYDMTACFFSFQILWQYFLSMIVSSSLIFKKTELLPMIGVDFTKLSNPQHAIGFILKNMKQKKAYKRFLVLEFFPLVFYMKPEQNEIIQKINHAILKGKKNATTKSYYQDGITWASYLQRVSFLNYMDDTIDAKLQFLTILRFKSINFKEDVIVNMFDAVLFDEMEYFSKVKLLDLDSESTKSVMLPEMLHVRTLRSIFLSQLCAMVRYITMQLERTKLWNKGTKKSKLAECIISMLQNMNMCMFYNKNNQNLHKKITQFVETNSVDPQFYKSLKVYISLYDCNDYPFFRSISAYTHASHTNSATSVIIEIVEKNMPMLKDHLKFENTDISHFVFHYKQNRLRFNFYFTKNSFNSQKKITLDGYTNTLPKHVVIEASITDPQQEMEAYTVFIDMIKVLSKPLGTIHTILNKTKSKNSQLNQLFSFNTTRLKHIAGSFLYKNRFDNLRDLMLQITKNNSNFVLDIKILNLKDRFCNDTKKPWKHFNSIFKQFYVLLTYRALLTNPSGSPIFEKIHQDFDFVFKTQYYEDVLAYSYPLSIQLLSDNTFMFVN